MTNMSILLRRALAEERSLSDLEKEKTRLTPTMADFKLDVSTNQVYLCIHTDDHYVHIPVDSVTWKKLTKEFKYFRQASKPGFRSTSEVESSRLPHTGKPYIY